MVPAQGCEQPGRARREWKPPLPNHSPAATGAASVAPMQCRRARRRSRRCSLTLPSGCWSGTVRTSGRTGEPPLPRGMCLLGCGRAGWGPRAPGAGQGRHAGVCRCCLPLVAQPTARTHHHVLLYPSSTPVCCSDKVLTVDLRNPWQWFPMARALDRRCALHACMPGEPCLGAEGGLVDGRCRVWAAAVLQ